MRAVVCTKYGPPEVLELRDVERPAPKRDEVLIKVHATAVMSGDCRMRSLDFSNVPFLTRTLAQAALGWRKPRRPILGICLAGEIETAGAAVRRFKAGDQVYADTALTMRFGAYAEYACLPECGLMTKKPSCATEDILADMKRRMDLGLCEAAEAICCGIVLGLHKAKGSGLDGPLG